MARTVLLMLTNTYPFGFGEEFIENEIGHLARAFDTVLVAATKTVEGAQQTRTLPDNVFAFKAGRDLPSDREGRLRLARAGVPRLRWGNLREAGFHPRRIALDAHAAALAGQAMDQLASELEEHWQHWDLAEAQVTVYSYWLLSPALVALQVTDWLRERGVEVTGVLSRGHGYDVYAHRSSDHYLPFRRVLVKGLDRILVVSENGRDAVLTSAGDLPGVRDKVAVAHLGTADPGPAIELSRVPFHVVTCAYVKPVKRLDRVPRVLAKLQASGVAVTWTHIGAGAGLGALQEQADRVVPGMATFVGHVPHDELIETYRRLRPSVLVNLSSSEGLPVNLMEGASLGVPLVATNVGGCAEIVRDGVNGSLLPADFTDDQAAKALHRLATADESDYVAMGRRSREIWAASFDQAVAYPEFVAELRSLGAVNRG